MDQGLREEIQTMVKAAIGEYHAVNVQALGRLELGQTQITERIINIDGNGTGRIGALQKQDIKLESISHDLNEMSDTMKGAIFDIKAKVSDMAQKQSSVQKAKIFAFAKWILGGIGALFLMILSLIIEHKYIHI